jgi:hypothetical protein
MIYALKSQLFSIHLSIIYLLKEVLAVFIICTVFTKRVVFID